MRKLGSDCQSMTNKRYFSGAKCNAGWQQLESADASRFRGWGWWTFRRHLLDERGKTCALCSVAMATGLHLHHIRKLVTHRHLRFEKSNIIVCCQSCHNRMEGKYATAVPVAASGMSFEEAKKLKDVKKLKDKGKTARMPKNKELNSFTDLCEGILSGKLYA